MLDDYMFPTTSVGLREAGMVCESAKKKDADEEPDDSQGFSDFDTRSRAMSSVLVWVDEGVYTYDALDETIIVASDLDGDFDISEEEEGEYSDIWGEVPYALLALGAELNDVQKIFDGPNEEADKAAARVGAALKAALDEDPAEDDDIITDFALGDAVMEGVFEASFKRKKVVRDGQVMIVRKRVGGKVRLSAAQKAGLRKARRKANSAAARIRRKKSVKQGKKRGLY